MKNWIELCADLNWETYGGTWAKQSKRNPAVWYVIEHVDLFEAMGERDTEQSGLDRYLASVYRIDLSDIAPEDLEKAYEFCGSRENGEPSLLETVYALKAYGLAAPMGEHSNPHYPTRARAAARREAESLLRDETRETELLDRTVNRLGSTAREYGRGDIDSALQRYKASTQSDPTLDVVLKIHGMTKGSK